MSITGAAVRPPSVLLVLNVVCSRRRACEFGGSCESVTSAALGAGGGGGVLGVVVVVEVVVVGGECD